MALQLKDHEGSTLLGELSGSLPREREQGNIAVWLSLYCDYRG